MDAASYYEDAYNAADGIHNEGFYFVVTQEEESRWPILAKALREAGLNEHADVFDDFLRKDGEALAAQSTLPPGSPDFAPTKDWDAEFAAILDRNGETYVEDKLEEYRVRHGLEEL